MKGLGTPWILWNCKSEFITSKSTSILTEGRERPFPNVLYVVDNHVKSYEVNDGDRKVCLHFGVALRETLNSNELSRLRVNKEVNLQIIDSGRETVEDRLRLAPEKEFLESRNMKKRYGD